MISAVNLIEGGPLTVLRDCLGAAFETISDQWEIIVLVHDRQLVETRPGLQVIEFPLAKQSWFLRLYYEWWYFRQLSKQLKPDLWLSLHDITPRVISRRQAVYCHNPSSFYQISLREAWLEPKFFLFNLFYRHLYGCGIARNRHVIVQQVWLRNEFQRLYGLSKVVVAYPQVVPKPLPLIGSHKKDENQPLVFLYPALPRVFKNIEMICEAVRILSVEGISGFEVRLTLDGSENRYASWLKKKYSGIPGIAFIGRQNQTQMAEQYLASDCLLFSSRLETWGLPISEAKSYGIPMLVADLPYAHETVGSYDRVCFFNPNDAKTLASLMMYFIEGGLEFQETQAEIPSQPFVDSWPALLCTLTQDMQPDI